MKKILIVSIILSCLMTDFALAKTEKFSGPSILLGLSSVGSNSKISGDYETLNSTGNNSQSITTGASYLHSINNDWLIGAGVGYDFGNSKSESKGFVGNGDILRISNKEHLSIYLQPTYAINDNVALFGKIGYHRSKVIVFNITNEFYESLLYSDNIHGIGGGLGLIASLNKNIFLKLEIEYVDYQANSFQYAILQIIEPVSTRYKLTTTAGIFSLGYKF